MRPSRLARELASFPFTKLKPESFQVMLASLSESTLTAMPLRVCVDTIDVNEVVKHVGAARVLGVYSHLSPPVVAVEMSGGELADLARLPVVQAIWNDDLAQSQAAVVRRPDPRTMAVASRALGRRGSSGYRRLRS